MTSRHCFAFCAGSYFVSWLLFACTVKNDAEASTPHAERSHGVSQPQAQNSVDFGPVSVDDGPASREHVFKLKNSSAKPVEIVKVTSTCGCVKAEAADSRLEPGQETEVAVAIIVSGVGQSRQSATVLFDDGVSTKFFVRAIGTRVSQLTVIPERVRLVGDDREFDVTLYVVDRRGVGESGPIVFRCGDEQLSTSADQWNTIEAYEPANQRPMRQMSKVRVVMSEYKGQFPAEIVIKTASGLESRLTVDHVPTGS